MKLKVSILKIEGNQFQAASYCEVCNKFIEAAKPRSSSY